jgi:hypothetical protein
MIDEVRVRYSGINASDKYQVVQENLPYPGLEDP